MADPRRGQLQSLRDGNRERLLELLRENGVLHRAELARRAGVSRTTVSTIVSQLLEDGLIVEVAGESADDTGQEFGARKKTGLSLDPRAGAVLGLDFSGTGVNGVVADLSHRVIAEGRRSLGTELTWHERLDVGADLAGDLLEQGDTTWAQVIGAGLGVPGPVDQRTGEIGASSRSLPWVGAHAADDLSKRLRVPVALDNTAHLAALAEVAWGAARGRENVICVKVSSGVSSGLILDGRVFRGAVGSTGGVGHMTINTNGPLCSCGGRGCLELYTSVPAILDALRPVCGDLTFDEAVELADGGHRACRRILHDAAHTLGHGLAGICNVLNPDLIVIGGDFGRAGDHVMVPLREAIHEYALPMAAEELQVVPSEFGDRAGSLGGVALVLREGERLAGNSH